MPASLGFRGHAQAARSTAYTVTIESVRAHWLQVAASWDRLADLQEMAVISEQEDSVALH